MPISSHRIVAFAFRRFVQGAVQQVIGTGATGRELRDVKRLGEISLQILLCSCQFKCDVICRPCHLSWQSQHSAESA